MNEKVLKISSQIIDIAIDKRLTSNERLQCLQLLRDMTDELIIKIRKELTA